MTQLLVSQNRHYRNTKATGLFGNIGMEGWCDLKSIFSILYPKSPLS